MMTEEYILSQWDNFKSIYVSNDELLSALRILRIRRKINKFTIIFEGSGYTIFNPL